MTDRDRWHRNSRTVREMFASLSAGDASGYLGHLADAAEYVAPYYPEMPIRRGRQEIATLLANLFTRFSSVSYAVDELFETVDPDLVIFTARGDNRVAGTELPYRNHYVMVVRFDPDGRVTRWTEYSDPNTYARAVSPGRG